MCKEKITIAFAGLYNDDNLGDPVIARCTEDMFLGCLPMERVNVKHISLNHFIYNEPAGCLKQWWRIAGLLKIKNEYIENRCITKEYIDYFYKELKGVDAVVIVGGGLLEFTGGRFADGMYAIALAGDKHGFPVIINASGVEGYDENNSKCLEIKKMLHRPSIKYVSTRDDFDTLFNKYYDGKPTAECEKVADPAVWAAEIFGVKRNCHSNVVGLGVVRSNIFENYGLKYSKEQLKTLYIDIVKRLLAEGNQVHLFTNGTIADNKFVYEIAESFKKENVELQIDIPETAEELIKNIAQYKGVIAGRLHSCIISYSLDIPAIGLVWNDKLSLFGKNIGEELNYMSVEQFDAEKIVQQLNRTIQDGYNQQIRDAFRQTIKKSIEKVVNKYIRVKL